MNKMIIVLALLTGCAEQPTRVANTNWPEIVLPMGRDAATDFVVAKFPQKIDTIEDATKFLIQIRRNEKMSATYMALFSCASCEKPYIRINIVLSDSGEGTKAVAQYWMVTPKYNGAQDRSELDNPTMFNEIQRELWNLRDLAAR